MSLFFFGTSTDKPTRAEARRMHAAANKHGADFVEVNETTGQYSRWFEVENRGEPFNRQAAAAVLAELEAKP